MWLVPCAQTSNYAPEPTTDWSKVTGVASAVLGQTGVELELGQGQVHPDAGSCMQPLLSRQTGRQFVTYVAALSWYTSKGSCCLRRA